MSGTPHSAYIEHDVITVQDASNTTQMRSTGISLSAAGSITFGDATVQITAANPFNGGTISGDITIADAGDYNANYAKNYLNLAGPGTYVNIQADYGIDLSNSNTGTELYLTSSGITFPDSTVQTTAYTGGGGGVPEAPVDGYIYGRVNATWFRIPGLSPFLTIAANVTSISSWVVDGGKTLYLASGNVTTLDASTIGSLNANGGGTASTTFSLSDFSVLTNLTIQNMSSMTATPDISSLSDTLTYANFSYNTAITTAPSFASFSYLTSANCSYNTSMTSTPSFSGCSVLTSATVVGNSSMTSAPSFSGFTNLTSVSVDTNATMTSSPDFSGCSALTSGSCSDNPAMTAGPSFSYCSALSSFYCNDNTLMSTPPDLTGCTNLSGPQLFNNPAMTSPPSLSQAYGTLTSVSLFNNTSMTSAPSVSGCTALSYVSLNNCAISNCDSILNELYSNGTYGGFIDISGGTNQSYDSTSLPSSITNLQSNGWGISYNSY
jgi:hypothetical protein